MWVPAVGTVMSIAMVFPIAVASTNFHATAFKDVSEYGIICPHVLLFSAHYHTLFLVTLGLYSQYLQLLSSHSFQSLMNFISINAFTDSSV